MSHPDITSEDECDHCDIDRDKRICLLCDRDMSEYLVGEAEWQLEDR